MQAEATPAAVGRLAFEGLPKSLGWDQGSGLMAMTGLTASLLARGQRRGSSFDRGWIGGRGLGGVGGILAKPLFQIGDPALEGLHQGQNRRLSVGWECVPDGL